MVLVSGSVGESTLSAGVRQALETEARLVEVGCSHWEFCDFSFMLLRHGVWCSGIFSFSV